MSEGQTTEELEAKLCLEIDHLADGVVHTLCTRGLVACKENATTDEQVSDDDFETLYTLYSGDAEAVDGLVNKQMPEVDAHAF